jgi:hypothetical protein
MKKVITLFVAFTLAISSFGAFNITTPPSNAVEIFIPVGATGKKISLLELSKISITDYQTLSGRTMKRADKVGFQMAQKKLRNNIKADGTIKNKKFNAFAGKLGGGETGFHLGGFALGFFLGVLGVLIAYVAFSDDFKANRTKWSWIGLGLGIVLSVILVVAALSSVKNY